MIWRSKCGIIVCKWKEKREVLTISNAHNSEMVKVSNRRGKEKMKPNIVQDYSNSMSGIDWSDQRLSLRKTLRWYKKARVHILEIFWAANIVQQTKSGVNRAINVAIVLTDQPFVLTCASSCTMSH